MREVAGRYGTPVRVPEARALQTRSSNVHWLTPRAFRLWLEVGLRRHTVDGVPEQGWTGRLEARNTAFAELLFSSGVRLTEGASMLTLEMPQPALGAGRFCPGRLGRAVTKSKRARTFYVAAAVVSAVAGYVESSRAAAVGRAQRRGRYEDLVQCRVVRSVTGQRQKVLHWRDAQGHEGRTPLTDAGVAERMSFYRKGPQGLEPLWLWLTEEGLPLRPASWENVFRTASQRCEQVLAGRVAEPPFCTPHMCRHSFALHMLVVLHHVMDRRMGLSVQERRDLLGGPDGAIRPELAAFHDALTGAERPDVAMAWISRSKARDPLERICRDERPVTHEVLDELPAGKVLAHLRSVLVATSALPPRDERLIALEKKRITVTVEARFDLAERRILHGYAVWHHMRRLRRRLGDDHTTRLQDLNVRCHVTAAGNFLDWLGGEGLTLGT